MCELTALHRCFAYFAVFKILCVCAAAAATAAQEERQRLELALVDAFWDKTGADMAAVNVHNHDFRTQELPMARVKKIMKLEDPIRVRGSCSTRKLRLLGSHESCRERSWLVVVCSFDIVVSKACSIMCQRYRQRTQHLCLHTRFHMCKLPITMPSRPVCHALRHLLFSKQRTLGA